ncbi:tail fiber domain-containing protein [Moorena sp. SIO3B2]|uniref:tail fiber domain-containing protein n=1 Tax=Moorena sp. SIO3B2 TaxID=2607827 RepID=UPI0013CD16F8|nr:tail fiber domain-containing protein [Moorena sp. SIO3B2]NEP35885.1 tail fiber domain-containing protein [Moorena sp. SIO3B2]
MSRWPDPELTVSDRVGIGTDTPSQELEVIGDISARNLNLNGSLTIDENLTVGGNFQLGTLSINAFSSDGNLADNSNLAVPTEQAVKTYVDNEISTRAALNGAASQDFATNNLSVSGNLRVSGNLEVQGDVIARDTEHIAGNVSLGDQDSDEVKITGVIRSGHSSGALRIDDALHTTGALRVDGSLSVRDAIATAQLSVTDRVSGSLTIENNLTVGGLLATTLEVSGALKLATTGTQIFHSTNESGTPSGDGFRLRYDNTFFGTNLDALVIEKTDGNHINPDGGIAFVNTGNDGIEETALVIRGNSNVGIGTTNPSQKLDVSGSVNINGDLNVTGSIAGLEVSGALKLATTGTQIFHSTNESGTPSGDGFRLRYDNTFFGTNLDALVIEKTDGNNPNPDGGIAFVNTGNDGVVETALVIRGNGNVGIGTTSPGAKLDVNGTTKTQKLRLADKWLLSGVGDVHHNDDWLRLFDHNGSGYFGGFAAGRLWSSSGTLSGSDLRLKKDIANLEQSLEKLIKLRGVHYRWKDSSRDQSLQIGLIAQEVETVFPELVEVGPDGMKSLNYEGLISPLIEAIKEQQVQITQLRTELQVLKSLSKV